MMVTMPRRPDIANNRPAIAVMVVEDPADAGPANRARWANVLLPGAGLILRDHIAWGLATGLAFFLPLAWALYASWIAPARTPFDLPLLLMTLTGVAMLAYLLSQWKLLKLLARREAELADWAAATAPLMRRVYQAMSDADWIEAQVQLDALLETDGEHFEANLTQARLWAIESKADLALGAYARCRRLEFGRRWQWEIDRELNLLST